MFSVTLDDVCSHPFTGFLWSICGPFSIGADVDYGQIVKFYDAEAIGPGRYRPAPEDVEAFLVTSLKISSAKETLPLNVHRGASTAQASAPISERGVAYTIFGQGKHASNAIDALIDVLRTLASKNLQFIETVAPLVQGRTRNHIARSRADVYPQKPELAEYAVELVPGWWLGTNISNRDKMRIIKKACEIEGLVLGKDIIITLPNA